MDYLVMMMNNLLEKKTYYQMLFNFYGNLLTEKQKELFIAYYENDFSLQEIADEFNISRNAVHDALKNAIKNLEHFEESLKLYKKYMLFEQLEEEYKYDSKCMELLNKIKTGTVKLDQVTIDKCAVLINKYSADCSAEI